MGKSYEKALTSEYTTVSGFLSVSVLLSFLPSVPYSPGRGPVDPTLGAAFILFDFSLVEMCDDDTDIQKFLVSF